MRRVSLHALGAILCATGRAASAQHPLLAWLRDLPGATVDSIELRKSGCGDGIGAFLTRSVHAGDELFAIPARAFVSLESAVIDDQPTGSALRQLWEQTEEYS